MRKLLVALAALVLGCSGLPREGAPSEAKEPAADRIFLGDILTIDASDTVARAVAVKDGRVLLVGDEKSVLQHRGRQTEVVDLGAGALLPGFVDPHSHLAGARGADHGVGERVAAAGRRGREHPGAARGARGARQEGRGDARRAGSSGTATTRRGSPNGAS